MGRGDSWIAMFFSCAFCAVYGGFGQLGFALLLALPIGACVAYAQRHDEENVFLRLERGYALSVAVIATALGLMRIMGG